MKIDSITVSNYLGAVEVNVATRETIQLFCGRNGAGKSSVRDAVALALTGDLGRVSLKKEAGELVHRGAAAATCELVDADGDSYGVTITAAGKVVESRGGREADPLFAYVLDAQRFARLEPKERRGFLFGLMGLKLSPAAIAQRLLAKGCAKAKIDAVASMLRAGFDAAAGHAKEHATQAKGAWRTVTGETYGDKKAIGWAAQKPAFDAAALAAANQQLTTIDAAIAAANQSLGALRSDKRRHDEMRAKLPALLETAGRLSRIQDKLKTDEAELQRVATELEGARALAGSGQRTGLVHDLAASLNWAINFCAEDATEIADALAALDAYERTHGAIGQAAGSPEAGARVATLQQAHDTCSRAVANDRRDLAEAERAAVVAKDIEEATKNPIDAAALAAGEAELSKLQSQRATAASATEALRKAKEAADAADKKSADAAAHHADVVAWDAVAVALGPDGIPADMLGEALGPLNTRLMQSATDSDWPLVVVHADMAITSGGRDYRLLSESERWRVDAVIAEAIAQLSGARLLVLDRVDVLDADGRGQLLGWLDALATTGEIDTALLFATLRAAPAKLPNTARAHWIESGCVTTGELALQEAA
jgi:hypothetical protein